MSARDPLIEEFKRLRVPVACDRAKGRALRHALWALAASREEVSDLSGLAQPAPAGKSLSIWPVRPCRHAVVLVILCCLAGAWIFGWAFRRSGQERLDGGHLLAEFEILFPGQVRALVARGSEIGLRLGDEICPRPSDQRVEFAFVEGGRAVRVFTYSGNRVCLEWKDRPVCVTALISGSGDVVLIPDQPAGAADWPGARPAKASRLRS